MSWRSQVVILGGGIRTSPLTAALALPGWAERKSQRILEGEIPGLTSPNPSPTPLPPALQPMCLSSPTHRVAKAWRRWLCQESIIKDFIIYFSSLRTNSSLQHANLLFRISNTQMTFKHIIGNALGGKVKTPPLLELQTWSRNAEKGISKVEARMTTLKQRDEGIQWDWQIQPRRVRLYRGEHAQRCYERGERGGEKRVFSLLVPGSKGMKSHSVSLNTFPHCL